MSEKQGSALWAALVGVVVILAVAAVYALVGRRTEYHALARDTAAHLVPTVSVVHPTAGATDDDLVLPSTLQAYVESPIYARTNGYLKKWYYDLGSHVAKGDLLADLDTPEIDQELAQAKAAEQQVSANVELAKSSAERWENLRKSDAVSQQELDEKKSAYAQLQASLTAAQANVQRLQELESFKHVYAPFSGVITRRNVDVGTLVNAGNGGAVEQLFHLSETDPLRVFVQVPESAASAMHRGLVATLEITQFPGETFTGEVVRSAGAIDVSTRTLLTEIDVPNPKGRLLPGGYAQVHLKVAGGGVHVQVPVNALLFRAEGLRAVVVDATHHVHLRPLTIGRDFGTTLEVVQGLSKDDWIVINPADSIEDGQEVKVAETPAAAAGGAGSR